MESNQAIAAALRQEAAQREDYGGIALSNAASIIASFPFLITSTEQLRGIKGIGKGVLERVRLFLLSAPMSAAGEAISAVDDDSPYDFSSLKFFGPATIKKLTAVGVSSLNDLRRLVASDLVSLTANQLASLKYREDLAERIPWEEVEEIGEEVLAVASTLDMTGEIVGSYRRGGEDSGDVDVLLTGKVNNIEALVERLFDDGLIRYIFSQGNVKVMAIALAGSGTKRRVLDIRFVPPESFGFALLFATGPASFNIALRQKAKEAGLTLNEYGIVDAEGNMFTAETEEEVFSLLGDSYVETWLR